ncbi:hypothetical protein [Azospirillum formosense]|uniref:hypothetical protein n=1 Tax=Azospirillum formosense TaxID=861533 RepID=UPI00157B2F05|nr:hypothetical protein [Azospirillum formosense]MBY3754365.1 hypothetical protein [Azospirillum formosense]
MLDDVAAAYVVDAILVPPHVAEHALRAPGPGVADLFGQLPTVLALGAAEQPFQVLRAC